MKKTLVLALTAAMVLGLCACGKTNAAVDAEVAEEIEAATEELVDAVDEAVAEVEDATEEVTEDVAEETTDAAVMTYADYVAAELDSEVTVETYVQATQSWWDNKITVYSQDEDGAYFLYNMACSEEDAAKLVPGTKIKVTGFKSEWSGEVEIVDATFEFVDGSYVAEATDVTDIYGTEDIDAQMNKFVAVNGLTVVASTDADGNEAAFLYNWDGSGEAGTDADLYFNASLGDQTYTFTVEYYLCNEESDAYKAVTGLNIGDTIDLEGFLYWYEGAQPHVTKVTVK